MISTQTRFGRLQPWIAIALLCLLGAAGCAGRAWNAALEEDSATAYYQFLRSYPQSRYAEQAREHIAFHKLKRKPTIEGFEAFRARYPQSTLLDGLRADLERVRFEAARAAGTPQAYEDFAREFPDGKRAQRARGNAAYLRAAGFGGDARRLLEFAKQHPESDFAAEARRSAAAAALRDRAPIRSVGLVVEVPPDAPEARRVAQAIAEHAVESYAHRGIRLQPLAAADSARASGMDALLVIRHREEAVGTSLSGGVLARPGVRATTRVTLTRNGDPPRNVWDRTFTLHVEAREHVAGTSVLFGSAGPRFWESFFVPFASWPSRQTVRPPIELATADAKLAAVDARGDRAVAVLENGSVRVVQLADPASPVVLGEYARKADLERFDGVRILGDQIAIFGPDGLEVLQVGTAGLTPVATYSRGRVGSVFAVEPVAGELLLASNKGLLAAPRGDAPPQRIMRQAILAMARSGELLVVADEDTVFLSSLPLLKAKRVLGQLRVGKDFGTHRIRIFGTTAFVIGDGGVLVLDVSDAREPRPRARLLPERVGHVDDVALVGGRVYLVGDRGVQVLAPRLDRVGENVDAVPARSAAALGRHLVVAGDARLQVVDGAPFASGRRASGVARVR